MPPNPSSSGRGRGGGNSHKPGSLLQELVWDDKEELVLVKLPLGGLAFMTREEAKVLNTTPMPAEEAVVILGGGKASPF